MDALGVNAFASQVANCGSSTLNWLFQWQAGAFIQCVENTGLSNSCARCYEGSGRYGYDNCKFACLTSWCSEGCLSCTSGYNAELEQCVGRPYEPATPCNGALLEVQEKVDVEAGCTAADYAHMDALGVNAFASQVANCGSSTLNWLFQWQAGAFIQCVENTGLSNSCARCYEGSGRYGYDNCKFACLTSWCSEGCLSCTSGYNTELEQCVGRPYEPATPC